MGSPKSPKLPPSFSSVLLECCHAFLSSHFYSFSSSLLLGDDDAAAAAADDDEDDDDACLIFEENGKLFTLTRETADNCLSPLARKCEASSPAQLCLRYCDWPTSPAPLTVFTSSVTHLVSPLIP
ncbi:hypothetical protein HOY82DRAFT_598931 [Tuber indicum]|nr:hypothetical protein HOY82DRAFT_598931 [Tuber indicum]